MSDVRTVVCDGCGALLTEYYVSVHYVGKYSAFPEKKQDYCMPCWKKSTHHPNERADGMVFRQESLASSKTP